MQETFFAANWHNRAQRESRNRTSEPYALNFLTDIAAFLPALWEGFLNTAAVSIGAIFGSLLVGLGLALTLVYGAKWPRRVAFIYIETFRNISFLVLIFFFYYGLPELGIFIDAFWTGVLTLSLAVGAYVADAIAAGLKNVSQDVIRAGKVFGLSGAQRVRHIELPIALRVSLRPMGSLFINLILTTSILSTITLNELTNAAKIIASTTFRPFEVYVLLLILYSILTHICALVVDLAHRRANRHLVA